jgi:hypothetical protein
MHLLDSGPKHNKLVDLIRGSDPPHGVQPFALNANLEPQLCSCTMPVGTGPVLGPVGSTREAINHARSLSILHSPPQW